MKKSLGSGAETIHSSLSYFWFQLFVIALALSSSVGLNQGAVLPKQVQPETVSSPASINTAEQIRDEPGRDSEPNSEQESGQKFGLDSFEEVRAVLEDGLQTVLGAAGYAKLLKASSSPTEVTIRLTGVFEKGRFTLSHEVSPLVKKALFLLKPYHHLNLRLVGHTARSEKNHLELSFKRANAVLAAIKENAELMNINLGSIFDLISISVPDTRIFLTQSSDSDELSIVDRQVEWVISRGR